MPINRTELLYMRVGRDKRWGRPPRMECLPLRPLEKRKRRSPSEIRRSNKLQEKLRAQLAELE